MLPAIIVIDIDTGPFGGLIYLELGGTAEVWPTQPVDWEKVTVAAAGA
ncbi:hypothetical protein LZG04_20265 [Saccharothrix sp. S26]|nr:hypothetical protein [Saccharothrix sp. S26]MCE6997118.1 hypothetical protein [Saccharothrix sp. S26]